MPFPTSPFRRFVVVAALGLAPALFVAQTLLAPDQSGTSQHQIDAIAAHPLAAQLSIISAALSQLTLLIIVLGLMELTRTGARRLSAIGGSLAFLAAFGHTYNAGAQGAMLTVADPRFSGADPAQIYDAMRNAWPFLMFSGLPTLFFLFGWILLCIALWRSRAMPRLVPVGILVAFVLDFGVGAAVPAGSVVAGLVFLAATGTIAYRILASRDAVARVPETVAQR